MWFMTLEDICFSSNKQNDTTYLEDGNSSLFIRYKKVQARQDVGQNILVSTFVFFWRSYFL